MKILMVAEISSIHSARWINQLKDTGWDVYVLQPLLPENGINEDLKFGKIYCPFSTKSIDGRFFNFCFKKFSKRFPGTGKKLYQTYVRYFIYSLNPDVIHSLGLNVNWRNLCLPIYLARQKLGDRFTWPWVYSSWGTDLEIYAQKSPENRDEVEKILNSCDYYIAECKRDERLAKELGFRGQFLGYYPAFGGVNRTYYDNLLNPEKTSMRKNIFLKDRGCHQLPWQTGT